MTESEKKFRDKVSRLSDDKREKIAYHLRMASAQINHVETELTGTELEHSSLHVGKRPSTLWVELYFLYKIFSDI
jgi:hypothetical protein